MKKLIVNADDFGSHELVNSAVEYAFNNGICRSASLMAGGKFFNHAVEIAKSHKDLGVGIHFTLVKGSPVLPPSEIKSLVNSSGDFYEDFSVFVKRYLTGRINFDEVRAELSAQAQKIQNAGLKISHFDSHQHLHVLPKIFSITADLSQKLNIKAMRMPHAQGVFPFSKTALNFLASNAKRKAKQFGFSTPDYFYGIVAGEAVNEKWLCSVIDKIKIARRLTASTTEIMVHIGENNKILQKFLDWNHDFESEFNAVKSDTVKGKIKDNSIKITNFFHIQE